MDGGSADHAGAVYLPPLRATPPADHCTAFPWLTWPPGPVLKAAGGSACLAFSLR
jgi:hypothetical protein